jgi:hypothetical protein
MWEAQRAVTAQMERLKMNEKKESVSTVYIPKNGYQPICKGLDLEGELIWDLKMKEPWHLKMFPVHYTGDFSEQWMYLILMEKGIEWDRPETIDDQFSRSARNLLRKIAQAEASNK